MAGFYLLWDVDGPTVRDLGIQGDGRLVGPAAGHVPDGVAPAAQHQHGQVEGLHVLHTLGVSWGVNRRGGVEGQTHTGEGGVGSEPHRGRARTLHTQGCYKDTLLQTLHYGNTAERQNTPHCRPAARPPKQPGATPKRSGATPEQPGATLRAAMGSPQSRPGPSLPRIDRLKQPRRSPESESAPHCSTTALGWYISITLAITYTQHTSHMLSPTPNTHFNICPPTC